MIGRLEHLYGIVGRWFFALGVALSGVQQVVRGGFIRLVPGPAKDMPEPVVAARVFGVILIVLGVGLLVRPTRRVAAWGVAALLVVLMVRFRIPEIMSNPGAGYVWTNPAKVLALIGGAWMLALPDRRPAWMWRLGPVFLAIFLVLGGIQHFVYADFVDTLVPAWMGHLRFWTCLAGVCLIAGGVGLLVPPTARCAAAMTALMIFLWVVMLHIPRALAMPAQPGETSAIFEALATSGVALLVAAGSRVTAAVPATRRD